MINRNEKVMRKRSTSVAPSERRIHWLEDFPGECRRKVAFEPGDPKRMLVSGHRAESSPVGFHESSPLQDESAAE